MLARIIDKLIEFYENVSEDYLGLVAAGIAFYFLMAAFPALAAAISLYGLFSDPVFVSDQINILSRFLPKEALEIFASQATALVQTGSGALGIGFIISVIFAIYSSTKGIAALIKGLNIAYNVREKRNYFKLLLTGFTLTFVLMGYLLIALSLIAGLPAVLNLIPLPDITSALYLYLRWPLLFITAMIGLEILYFFGPAHREPKWRWFSWGGLAATVMWLVVSNLFSLFVANFGKYNETYGSISAIIILLLWFWLSALMILIGAEINVTLRGHRKEQKKSGSPL